MFAKDAKENWFRPILIWFYEMRISKEIFEFQFHIIAGFLGLFSRFPTPVSPY